MSTIDTLRQFTWGYSLANVLTTVALFPWPPTTTILFIKPNVTQNLMHDDKQSKVPSQKHLHTSGAPILGLLFV